MTKTTNTINNTTNNALPTSAKLVKSTVISAAVAAGLLVTTVLPKTYGIDPTGIGKLLGIKCNPQQQAITATPQKINDGSSNDFGLLGWILPVAYAQETTPKKATKGEEKTSNSGSMTFSLKPNQAAEIKVTMQKGKTVTYNWKSNAGKANYDVHGDSKKIKYHRYSKGSAKQKKGKLTASFDGKHGWFWRNRSGKLLTITLNVSGDYGVLVRIK